VLEYARNVMGLRDAAHAETNLDASCLFITPLSCSLAGKTREVNIKAGTKAAAVYQTVRSMEACYCNFGLNPACQEEIERAGLAISGVDQDGEARIMEIPSHSFFLGTLFVPQARSARGCTHPLVLAFCRAAMRD
jgi:CTP synthase (UTP-ammonia lyase)